MTTPASANGFIATARSGAVQITTQNTAVDGTGTIVTVLQGAATPGTRVLQLRAVAAMAGASASGMVNLFRSWDSGTTWRFWRQIAMLGNTPSVAVQNANNTIGDDSLILASAAERIGAAPTVASQTINVIWDGGDL